MRINAKQLGRLRKLSNQIDLEFCDKNRMSMTVWRGDVNAIQWALSWIEKTTEAQRSTVDKRATEGRG